jgi:hypothetical protein
VSAAASEALLEDELADERDGELDATRNAPFGTDVETGQHRAAFGHSTRDEEAFAADAERQVDADLMILDGNADALRVDRQRAVGQFELVVGQSRARGIAMLSWGVERSTEDFRFKV